MLNNLIRIAEDEQLRDLLEAWRLDLIEKLAASGLISYIIEEEIIEIS